MGKTGIEWTRGPNGEQGYTFNPWIGCTRVSPACDNCYAAGAAVKMGVEWDGPVRRIAEAGWREPHRLNRLAQRLGVRFRVFTGSMCDVLDKNAYHEDRDRLWRTVEETPFLDWMILTKRPQLARRYMPPRWYQGQWPSNAWFGFTGENQKEFDRRWEHAKTVPAPILFVSMEPLLEPVNIEHALLERALFDMLVPMTPELAGKISTEFQQPVEIVTMRFLDLVIVGGESGRLADCRDMEDAWARDLLRQTRGKAAFFMKQMAQIRYRAGYKKMAAWPEDLRVREHPAAHY